MSIGPEKISGVARSETIMTELEVDALDKAKSANPWWFKAVVRAAQIMASRRVKYSADYDPFTNFDYVAHAVGLQTRNIFKFFRAIKLSRLVNTDTDFDDESYEDTLLDLGNYSFLEVGYRMREKEAESEG